MRGNVKVENEETFKMSSSSFMLKLYLKYYTLLLLLTYLVVWIGKYIKISL